MSTQTAAAKKTGGKTNKKLIGYIIGIICMLVLPQIVPTWATVTEMGVKMLCTFVGIMVIFMMSGDLIGGSLLGAIVVMLHGYNTANEMWVNLFGNNTSVQMIMMITYSVALRETGVMMMLGRWIVRKAKFLQKVPTVFNIAFMIAMFICNLFLSGTVMVFTLLPMFEGIASAVGYKPEEKWHKIMVTGMYMIAGAAAMSRGTGGMVTGFVNTFVKAVTFEYEFSAFQFMIASRVGMLLFVVVYCLFAKFIFRCDMSKLSEMDMESVPELKKENIKFTPDMIIMLFFFLLVILRGYLTAPFKAGTVAAQIYSVCSLSVVAMLALIVTSLLKYKGKPMTDMAKCFGKLTWGVVLSLGIMSCVAGAIAAPALGIRPWLLTILTPIFGGLPYPIFCFLILLFTCVITNLMSNQATIIIMLSITATFIETYVAQGINPTPLVGSIVMVGMIPLLTYSAGPLSPLYLDRPEMKADRKFVYSIGLLMMLLSTICMTVSAVVFGMAF